MIPVKDVQYIPTLESNLLSIKKLTKQGNVVMFQDINCVITKGKDVLAEGRSIIDLYQLTCEKINMVKQDHHQNCVHLWHRRLGHRDQEAVIKLSREKLADGIKIEACNKLLKCINCIKEKMARKTIPNNSSS